MQLGDDYADEYAFGLDLILDGLEAAPAGPSVGGLAMDPPLDSHAIQLRG